MQSYGLRATFFQNRISAVFPETILTNLQRRLPSGRRLILHFASLLLSAWAVLAPTAVNGTTLGTLSTTSTSASFGTVAVGTKNSQVIQLKNTGGSVLVLSSAALSGTGFSMSNLYIPLWMAPGVTMNLTVTFAPTTTGSKTGSIVLKSNGSNPTVTISLSGSGGSTTRTLSLSSSSISFGNQVVGSSNTIGVAVKNTGNASVTVSGVSVSGTGFSAGSGVSGATIAAGQSATLNVIFSPKATGSVTGKVSISSNASNTPNSVSASGTGVSSTGHFVSLSWSPSSSSGVIGYYVYRSTVSGGTFSRITSSTTTAANYTDGSVVSGGTYYYEVTSVTSAGVESGRSGQVKAVIP